MTDQTPERARKISRRCAFAGVGLFALNVPLGMLGFDMFRLPLTAIALVCFYAAGDHSGWADGWKAAKAGESDKILMPARETRTPLPGSNEENVDG